MAKTLSQPFLLCFDLNLKKLSLCYLERKKHKLRIIYETEEMSKKEFLQLLFCFWFFWLFLVAFLSFSCASFQSMRFNKLGHGLQISLSSEIDHSIRVLWEKLDGREALNLDVL
ncbi:hypothetical protein BpHYR1_029448 [Brachionus plicatilis]|uniref:Uncharacterized protein n=1 Tax=Brachionus plicatilis TaxID=10195 RepID=A0A3M7PX61_BRAPC|nr:hypothetical protein BpHYR1_029448 [Brachionus plicatilis]